MRITNEKINIIQDHMKVEQDRKRNYIYLKKMPFDMKPDDLVILKISPWKGLTRFKKKGKLSPRYLGSFKILKKIGSLA